MGSALIQSVDKIISVGRAIIIERADNVELDIWSDPLDVFVAATVDLAIRLCRDDASDLSAMAGAIMLPRTWLLIATGGIKVVVA